MCIASRLRCDRIESCADSSDELNCDFETTTMQQLPKSDAYLNATNSSTLPSFVTSTQETVSSRASYLIGFLVLLIVLMGVVAGVWVYGRRRRKWREFLAQLDNNTDWEYEQLEDAPSISSSHLATMTPVFNISNHINFNNREDRIESNTSQTNTSTNSRPGINERTPISLNT